MESPFKERFNQTAREVKAVLAREGRAVVGVSGEPVHWAGKVLWLDPSVAPLELPRREVGWKRIGNLLWANKDKEVTGRAESVVVAVYDEETNTTGIALGLVVGEEEAAQLGGEYRAFEEAA